MIILPFVISRKGTNIDQHVGKMDADYNNQCQYGNLHGIINCSSAVKVIHPQLSLDEFPNTLEAFLNRPQAKMYELWPGSIIPGTFGAVFGNDVYVNAGRSSIVW